MIHPIGRVMGVTQTIDDGGNSTMAAAFCEGGAKYFNFTIEAPNSAESKDEKLQAELWAYTDSIIRESVTKRS